MKNIYLILALIFLCTSEVAFADYAASDWKYVKAISGITADESGAFVRVYLDKEVSVHANQDLSDLRVLEDGAEVPYQLVTLSENVRSEYIQSTLHDISSRDGKTLFTIDLGASGVPSDHLRIVTESKNFKKSVSVYAADSALSVDAAGWRLLTDKGYIYNFHDNTSGFDAGSGEVRYPETASRYLKVVIGDGEGERVLLGSVQVFRISAQEGVENQILTTPSVVDNPERKTTEITVDLGAEGVPTHRITLATHDTKNFSRRALILSSNDAVTWTSVGGGYVFSLHTPLFSGQEFSLPYSEMRSRYIRVLILNQDDAPVAWDAQATLESTVRAVVFAVVAGKNYSLTYGNTLALSPSYDLARYFQYIESTSLKRAELAPETENQSYVRTKQPALPYSDAHPNLLNAVLVLLVTFLSTLMIIHIKKLKHMPRGSNE